MTGEPVYITEVKNLLANTQKKLEQNQKGITDGIQVVTKLVGEEVGHITKQLLDHQEKDNKMFTVLTTSVDEIKASGSRMEEKVSRVFLVICGDEQTGVKGQKDRLEELEIDMQKQKTLNNKAMGGIAILAFLFGSGVVYEILKHILH